MTNRLKLAVMATLLAVSPLMAGGSSVGNGDKIYLSKCASCHGKDGSGDTAMGKKLGLRSLKSAEVKKQTDEQLFAITAKGKKKMPAYEKKLTPAQISEVVAYIRMLE